MMHSLNHYGGRVTQSHRCYYCTYLQESLLHAVSGSDHSNRGSERVGVWKMDSLGDGSAFTKTQRSREQLKLLLTCQTLCIIYIQHVPVFCRSKRVFRHIDQNTQSPVVVHNPSKLYMIFWWFYYLLHYFFGLYVCFACEHF